MYCSHCAAHIAGWRGAQRLDTGLAGRPGMSLRPREAGLHDVMEHTGAAPPTIAMGKVGNARSTLYWGRKKLKVLGLKPTNARQRASTRKSSRAPCSESSSVVKGEGKQLNILDQCMK